jgi:hypothetical protein
MNEQETVCCSYCWTRAAASSCGAHRSSTCTDLLTNESQIEWSRSSKYKTNTQIFMWKTLQDEGKNHGHQSAKNFIISEVFTKRRSMATSYKMIYLYGDKSRLICRGGGGAFAPHPRHPWAAGDGPPFHSANMFKTPLAGEGGMEGYVHRQRWRSAVVTKCCRNACLIIGMITYSLPHALLLEAYPIIFLSLLWLMGLGRWTYIHPFFSYSDRTLRYWFYKAPFFDKIISTETWCMMRKEFWGGVGGEQPRLKWPPKLLLAWLPAALSPHWQ